MSPSIQASGPPRSYTRGQVIYDGANNAIHMISHDFRIIFDFFIPPQKQPHQLIFAQPWIFSGFSFLKSNSNVPKWRTMKYCFVSNFFFLNQNFKKGQMFSSSQHQWKIKHVHIISHFSNQCRTCIWIAQESHNTLIFLDRDRYTLPLPSPSYPLKRIPASDIFILVPESQSHFLTYNSNQIPTSSFPVMFL